MSREWIISTALGLAAAGTLLGGMGHIMHQSGLGAGLQPGKTIAVLGSYSILALLFLAVGPVGIIANVCAVVVGIFAGLARLAITILIVPLLIIVPIEIATNGILDSPFAVILGLLLSTSLPAFLVSD